MASWLDIPPDSDFSLDNLPFGIIVTVANTQPRAAVAVGDYVVDMAALAAQPGFGDVFPFLTGPEAQGVFAQPTLNAFAALGRPVHRATRLALQGLLRAAPATEAPAFLRDNEAARAAAVLPRADVQMQLPMAVGDYTDFYAGVHHARTAGTLFRGADKALQPNYHFLPVAYHGRASSVVVSGTPVRRPWGQTAPPVDADDDGEAAAPIVRPTVKLDFELELGCFVATANARGDAVPVAAAEDHIFGYVLLNDWSARDVQSWEYVPLGPFNGKNFQTTISPWVVLADALEPVKTAALVPERPLLPYLDGGVKPYAFDLEATVDLDTAEGTQVALTRVNTRNLQWSFPQMIAHHTLGGCPLRPGDLLGSGTISGTTADEAGCLLEKTSAGKDPVLLPGMDMRTYLEDGDRITIRASGVVPGGGRIGFGECTGRVYTADRLVFK